MSSFLPSTGLVGMPSPILGMPFPVVLILISIACLFVWYKRVIRQPEGSPPVFPFLVDALSGKFELKKHGPVKLIHAGYNKLGGCFSLQVLHNHVTMFVGPEAQGFFFSLRDKEADQKPVYQFTVPVFGKNIAYDAPRRRMDEQLRFLRYGLAGESMRRHGEKIVAEAQDFFSKLGSKPSVLNLHHTMSELIINTASRTLMGREIREHCHERFADLYQQLSDGMTHLTILFPNAPVPLHRARDKARVEIVSLFKEVINKKRARVAQGHALDPNEDLINFLLSKTYVNKDPVTDDDICGLLLATLFAGQHTSTITSTWLGMELVHKPDLIKKLKEEQRGVLEFHDGEMNWEALQDMKLLNACVRETLRKYPPLVMLMRKTLVPLKYKDFTIPKDRVICAVPSVGHQLEDVYPNPSEWDPSRFHREWDQEQLKRSWIPFGGGMHKCLGQQFGLMQVTAVWSLILRNFDIEPVDPVPGIDYSHLVAGPLPTTRIKFVPLVNGSPALPKPSTTKQSAYQQQEESAEGQTTETKSSKTFTKAEVAKHNIDGDCWVIIRGKVYDVTKFLRIHPGGKERLFQHAGSDATFAFEAQEHSARAQTRMTTYEIGVLAH